MSRAVVGATWIYMVAIIAIWALLRLGGDRWWLATLILYGPRWIYGLPLLVLIPVLLYMRRFSWALATSAIILVGPVMGCCLPWARPAAPDETVIRVLSLNIQEDYTNPAQLAGLISQIQPDIVALQECRADFQLNWPAGWHIQRYGRQITGSRFPLDAVRANQPDWSRGLVLATLVETPDRRFAFFNVHMNTPRYELEAVLDRRTVVDPAEAPGLQHAIQRRRRESAELLRWIERFSAPVVVAGDFNMPTDSAIYRDNWAKYHNAFSSAGFGFGHTKRTEVMGWQYGSRIDHILSSRVWRPCRSWVGPDVGSDHLPLIAELSSPAP